MTDNNTLHPDESEEFINTPDFDLIQDPEGLAVVAEDLSKNFGDMRKEGEQKEIRKQNKYGNYATF